MAVRDLLWGCPFCGTGGRIRKRRRHEQCMECGARFHRGRGATIIGRSGGTERVGTAAEWLARLGPPRTPPTAPDGRILGPERVAVKSTTGQEPLRSGDAFLGWIETYGPTRKGMLELRADGLHFQPRRGAAEHWSFDLITGLQPASSAIQVGFRGHMTSVRFVEGSVRLWTHAVGGLLREHYRRDGMQVLELQPHIRACPDVTSGS